MVAVGRPHDGGVIVAEVLPGEEAGAVGEDGIVLGEALLGGVERGDYEDRPGSEAQRDDRAVVGGESGEGAVERFLY